MSTEPTSVLSFQDLIIEVARKAGLAHYGDTGADEVQVPIDNHDLQECKRHVNNAIRMFLNDAPGSGWFFTRPIASVSIWGNIDTSITNLVTSGGYNQTLNRTTLDASEDSFFETMEGHDMVVTAVGTFVVHTYVNAQQVIVTGDASGAGTAGVTWSFTSDGNFTLPRTFGGQYHGKITYESDTNQGVSLDWTSESTIRQWREDITDEKGDPYRAADVIPQA